MPKTLPIHFAPLQGYTEVFYRNAHTACFGGIDTYYTPFVRLEKGGFRHRDVRGIEPGYRCAHQGYARRSRRNA